ncbi:G-protein coupled receptor [Biomphalaria pfeifferi]|uniref:G-protein coupled receptor n=1 Tax=Biomphalaria pfeifferi TaxID=112525 RepID=A0AAD8B909_BIOPF|nr:G-protein coupled receptor [Biomphalaria pfeifferi]
MKNNESEFFEDPEDSLVSEQDRNMFELVNLVVISSGIAVVGVVSNVINILVFYRQGLNSTVNISFTGLAVSDLCSLITLLCFNLFENPYFAKSGVPLLASEFQHLTCGFPHACFTRITSWITVYITAERCLCIALPLKVHRIITPRQTTLTIVIIYVWMIVSLLPEYVTVYIDWKFVAIFNKTVLGLAFTSDRPRVDGLSFMLYSIYMLVSFFAVVILTSVLFVKLKRNSERRKEVTNNTHPGSTVRDKKTLRMVVVIASVLIVTFTPQVVIFTAGFIEPGFSVVGRYANLFFVSWSFCFVFDAINSTANIVLYYKMSTKYRDTFRDIFSACIAEETQRFPTKK